LGRATTLEVDQSQLRFHRRIDIPWILEFVHTLESDPQIFRQLRLEANPCTFIRGGRAYLRELNPLQENGTGIRQASLGASNLVSRLLTMAQRPIKYEELLASLSTSDHGTELKAHAFITELWRQGFLLTELRPPFTAGDPVPRLLERLEGLAGAERYRATLEALRAGTEVSNVRAPASTRKSNAAEAEMTDGESLTHIDSILCTRGELNAAVAEEAAYAAELLLSLTPWPSGPPHLHAYRRIFEERYGEHREVPLLELTDSEYGIGFPSGYDGRKNTPSADVPQFLRSRREVLFDIAQQAYAEQRLEVELNAELRQQLRPLPLTTGSLPASLEINVFVSAASARDVDEGHFTVVVGPNVGAMEAGRSLGRFAEPLGPAGRRAFCDAAKCSETVRPSDHYVELSYLPRNLKLSNILVRPGTREYEIHVGVGAGVPRENSIPVRDLVVGLCDGLFYVRWPGLKGKLRICSGNMANPQFAPSLCRLLVELTFDGTAILREFDWGMASLLNFLPRVRVGRVVLSLARWRIPAAMVYKRLRIENGAAWRESLVRWRAEWKVPRHVYLAEADNRLLLDLENEMDAEDLRAELRRIPEGQALILSEVYPGLESAWQRGPTGSFMAEYVVPLVLKTGRQGAMAAEAPAQSSAFSTAPSPPEQRSIDRVKAPGSDWLYIKLYLAPSIADDVLIGSIAELAGWARESGIVSRWFFIRYADPDPHLRIRFQGAPATLKQTLLPRVLDWAQVLVNEKRCCLRFSLETYEREIDRYGGAQAIEIAEHLFFLDSESTLDLLRLLARRCPLRRSELAVAGLDVLFHNLGYSSSERLDFFNAVAAPRKDTSSEYRERKTILQALVGGRCPASIGPAVKTALNALEAGASQFAEAGRQLRQFDQEGRLTVPLSGILRSFAHMHCNRIGLDLTAERLAYGFLARSYESLRALACEPIVNDTSAIAAPARL
jgi:thiopeptide-type bacteriocin biosynthesis protein